MHSLVSSGYWAAKIGAIYVKDAYDCFASLSQSLISTISHVIQADATTYVISIHRSFCMHWIISKRRALFLSQKDLWKHSVVVDQKKREQIELNWVGSTQWTNNLRSEYSRHLHTWTRALNARNAYSILIKYLSVASTCTTYKTQLEPVEAK